LTQLKNNRIMIELRSPARIAEIDGERHSAGYIGKRSAWLDFACSKARYGGFRSQRTQYSSSHLFADQPQEEAIP